MISMWNIINTIDKDSCLFSCFIIWKRGEMCCLLLDRLWGASQQNKTDMICDVQTISALFLPRPFWYINKTGRLNPYWTRVPRAVLKNCKTRPRQYANFKHSMTEDIKLDKHMAYLISEIKVSCELPHQYRMHLSACLHDIFNKSPSILRTLHSV